MILNNDNRHPFVGAGTMFESPLGPNDYNPKAWGASAFMAQFAATIVDNTKNFFDENIQIGDPIFIMDSTPTVRVASTVVDILFANQLDIAYIAQNDLINVLYKVGEEALHSFDSLVAIIQDRGIGAYTIHWRRFWTSLPFPQFRPDEKGDVYVIDPDEEKKLLGKNRLNGQLVHRPSVEDIRALRAAHPEPY